MLHYFVVWKSYVDSTKLFGLLYKDQIVTGTPCYEPVMRKKSTHKDITKGFMLGLVSFLGSWQLEKAGLKRPAFIFTLNINLVMFWRMKCTTSVSE